MDQAKGSHKKISYNVLDGDYIIPYIAYREPIQGAWNVVGGDDERLRIIVVKITKPRWAVGKPPINFEFRVAVNSAPPPAVAWDDAEETHVNNLLPEGDARFSVKLEQNENLPNSISTIISVINTLLNGTGPDITNQNLYSMLDKMVGATDAKRAAAMIGAKNEVKILLRFLNVAYNIAEEIFPVGPAKPEKKIYFVIAFLVHLKTMGDYSNLKDTEWLANSYPNVEKQVPVFYDPILWTGDTFLDTISLFYTPNARPGPAAGEFEPNVQMYLSKKVDVDGSPINAVRTTKSVVVEQHGGGRWDRIHYKDAANYILGEGDVTRIDQAAAGLTDARINQFFFNNWNLWDGKKDIKLAQIADNALDIVNNIDDGEFLFIFDIMRKDILSGDEVEVWADQEGDLRLEDGIWVVERVRRRRRDTASIKKIETWGPPDQPPVGTRWTTFVQNLYVLDPIKRLDLQRPHWGGGGGGGGAAHTPLTGACTKFLNNMGLGRTRGAIEWLAEDPISYIYWALDARQDTDATAEDVRAMLEKKRWLRSQWRRQGVPERVAAAGPRIDDGPMSRAPRAERDGRRRWAPARTAQQNIYRDEGEAASSASSSSSDSLALGRLEDRSAASPPRGKRWRPEDVAGKHPRDIGSPERRRERGSGLRRSPPKSRAKTQRQVRAALRARAAEARREVGVNEGGGKKTRRHHIRRKKGRKTRRKMRRKKRRKTRRKRRRKKRRTRRKK